MRRRFRFFVVFLALLPSLAPARAEQPAFEPITRLSSVMILVADQEEALRWYTEKLGFAKKVDETYGEGMRWLTVAPKGEGAVEIVLEKAPAGKADQVGKSTAWVFETGDCRKAYEVLHARGVKFVSPPQDLPWGVQAVFKDLYGNTFTLISYKQ
jgi:predicted enzyme related to lactoylglutathione lyase